MSRRPSDLLSTSLGGFHGGLTSSVSASLPFVHTYEANGLTALGDPTRRVIFEHLAERPRAVGELASELPVSRPAVRST